MSLAEHQVAAFESMLARLSYGLASIGRTDFAALDRRSKLEFARHHGLPTPLIDFTRSPFIALWFAFNGVRASVDASKFVALYALNWNSLGVAYDELARAIGWYSGLKHQYKRPPMDVFRWEIPNFFENGYPMPALKFIPHGASWNTKMQRQMGCFIYDTLDYSELNTSDLEDLISNHEIMKRVNRALPIMTKFLIPCTLAREIFDYLDVIGINGSMLMNDVNGAVADVNNTFNYNPRSKAWDLLPPK